MNLFRRKPSGKPADTILDDLPRGQEGRLHKDNHLPHQYFETPENLAQIGFNDHSGEYFLGVINGSTEKIIRADGRPEYKTTGGVPVGILDDRHQTTIAGSRSGKGRSVIIPNLLTYGGSMVVIDPKGENAAITSRFRAEKLKQNVCILDPFNITPPHCKPYRKQFNPLRTLRLESPTLIEDAGLIADALVVATNPRDSHWDDTAKEFIEGVLLHVVTDFVPRKGEPEATLITVADLVSGRRKVGDEDEKWINGLLSEMLENTWLDGRIAAAARSLKEKPDNERGSVLSTVRKNLKFLQYDAMSSVSSGHDFDLEDLKATPMTIYLVLPAMRMATCRQWLRLFVNLTLAAVEKVQTRPQYPVQMLLDEFAVLGYMKELEAAIGQIAGLSLSIHSILQDLGQLKALYKDRYETFLGNSGIIRCFGVVDQFTSEWVSKYLDKTTIRVTDRRSTSFSEKTEQGSSGLSYRLQLQDLLTPAEVRRYFARDDRYNRQLVFVAGRRPLCLQRANYDQHEMFAGRFDGWR